MNGKDQFERALDYTTEVVDTVQPDDSGKPTPAKEWNVHKLAEHMLYELKWVPDMVGGVTIAEVGSKHEAPLTDSAFVATWRTAADAARHAVRAADLQGTVHMSAGDTTVDEYLQQISFELLIHSWDLATAIGQNLRFTDEVAQAAYDYAFQHAAEWSQVGLFAPPVSVPESADLQTKLLALTGRTTTS
jgi:uncharacterized protein (TIGR03086 family)